MSRVAFVPAARLFSDRLPNGEALIAEGLIRRLARRGHEIVAYCEKADFARPIDGVEVVEISAEAPSAALSRIAFARRIARDAAKRRFDIAHLLFPLSTEEGYTFVRDVPLVCGPMFVAWPSGTSARRRVVARAPGAMLDRLEHRLHGRTFERAARLMVTGAHASSHVPARWHDKTVEVPIGVDVDRFTPEPLPEDDSILFLSVIQPRKGIDVLVRAMPLVCERVPRARLLVAGDDPLEMRPGLELLARDLGVTHAVDFAGPVTPSDAPALHGRARVFCQPSLGEPYGMTVLEAMACGRPVVGTAAGGVTDLVVDGEGGRLVPPGDHRLLADALISVLEQRERTAAMGAYNRDRAVRRFSLDLVADHIEQTYDAVTRGAEVHAATA